MARKARLEFLDNLRGLAALYVLVHHVQSWPDPAIAPPGWAASLIEFGYSGVWLFFVISAFSLSLTMPRHVATGRPWLSFALSRLFRIAPLFYLLIVVQALVLYAQQGWWPSSSMIAAAVLFVFNLVPRLSVSPVMGGWAIGAEMIFYALFPLFWLFARETWKKIVLLVASILVFRIATGMSPLGDPDRWASYLDRSILKHLPSFLMGLICFDAYVALRDRPQAPAVGRAILAASVALLFVQALRPLAVPGLDPAQIEAAGYALVLLGAALSRPRALSLRIFSYYGQISYSVYLWHVQVIVLLLPVLRAITALPMSPGLSFGICLALVLAVTTALAHVTYLAVERPFERLGRQFVARRTGSVAQAG